MDQNHHTALPFSHIVLSLFIICCLGCSFASAPMHESLQESSLHQCIQNNNVARADILMGQKELVNAYDEHGFTPLHWAAITGNSEIAQHLVAADARIDLKTNNDEQFTPLYGAVLNGHTSVVHLLIDAGADPDAKNFDEATPIFASCANGDMEIFKFLMDSGANINAKTDMGTTCLMVASREGFDDIVTLLLEKGADVNAISKGPLFDAMQYAAFNNRTQVLKLLIEHNGRYTTSDESVIASVATAEAAKFTAKHFFQNQSYTSATSHYKTSATYFDKAAEHYDELSGNIIWEKVQRAFLSALLSGVGAGMYSAAGSNTIFITQYSNSDLDTLKKQFERQKKRCARESEKCMAQIEKLSKMKVIAGKVKPE